jgi:hypothetical protein
MGLTRAGSVHAGHAERRGHQAEASKSARVADIPATVAGLDGSNVRWLGNSSVRSLMIRVNVNTTDATTGATALLLPAQNSHTDPCA